ncbi:MAG: DUF1501 domain-containing protein [Planctomycetota bacterium]|nr:MAG: DUF1501 domain-containing protein [Planctomycetota bacterium]
MHQSTSDSRLDRRGVLVGGLSVFGGLALTSPAASAARWVASVAESSDRSLVLIQLSGGNDGLATVIPYADDDFQNARKTTRRGGGNVLKLDDYRGLHPGLTRFGELWHAGKLAIVEGAGYPDQLRSHFKALEIWHTGRRAGRVSGDGWIGRLTDAAWNDADHPELVVHVGAIAPYALHSSTHPPCSLESPAGYQWHGDRAESRSYAGAGAELEARRKRAGGSGRDAALAGLRRVLDDARDSSRRIRRAAASYVAAARYPRTPFAGNLHDIAALIEGDLGTRVFSAELGGFDTHASQRATHDGLMSTLDAALGAFIEDLSYSEAGRNTVVLVFSEFGRRVAENGSAGHDHGQAGPMFVLGHKVKGGLYGAHPSLTELDKGDLVFTTDFRSVYGSVIEGWFGVDHATVLGRRFPLLPLFP